MRHGRKTSASGQPTRKHRSSTGDYLQQLIDLLSQLFDRPCSVYLENQQIMDMDIHNVGWGRIAQQLKLPKKSLYNWYVDTYTRQLSQRLTPADKQIVADSITFALQRGIQLNRDFQHAIKTRLSQEYNRSEFSIVYNNELRKAKRAFGENQAMQELINMLAKQPIDLALLMCGGK